MSETSAIGVDPAFVDIDTCFTAFLVWRVEKLKLVHVPSELIGQFYEGDSYVVFVASEPSKTVDLTSKPYKVYGGRMEQHVHFWLGKNTSTDEAAVAAYKSVELDTFLGGTPVQHREVQERESTRFRGYFKKGIRYLIGGIASGLNHVDKLCEPKLYKVKGKRSPTVTQMPSIDWKYFNSDDVFILATNDGVVFIWIGNTANPMEKLQATKVAQQLKVEHKANALVFVEEGEELDLPEAEKIILGTYLDLHTSDYVKRNVNESDAVEEHNHYDQTTLYQCSDDNGMYKVTKVKTGLLYQSDLESKDSFIIDQDGKALWVWVGKGASKKERVEAIHNAHEFICDKNYDTSIPVTRVVENGEPVEFKGLFQTWRDPNEAVMSYNQNIIDNIAHVMPSKWDMASVHANSQISANSRLVDNGKGKKTMWRIKTVELEPVDESMYGVFFSGDCYLVHYQYKGGDILYYWLGSHSSIKEQTALTIQAIVKDTNDFSGNAVQIRLVQGKECLHFLTLFEGPAIIYKGAHQDVPPTNFLMQVTGINETNAKAVQVNMSASCLNSNDVFIVKMEETYLIWCGKGSSKNEREMAESVAKRISKDDCSVVLEGQETNEFWSTIGGREEYASSEKLAILVDMIPGRLFQISNATGNLTVEEIPNWSQQDLVPEDVMLLDVRDTIFLWFGDKANCEEMKESTNLALRYLKADPSHRDLDTPIVVIKQGHEPVTFTGFFGPWDAELWKSHRTFEELRKEIELENPRIPAS